MSEASQVQGKIIKYIFAMGGYAVNVITASKAGTSDLLACIEGRFFSIECKVGKNKASALQLEKLNEVRQAGGVGMVVYSLEDFIEQYKTITI